MRMLGGVSNFAGMIFVVIFVGVIAIVGVIVFVRGVVGALFGITSVEQLVRLRSDVGLPVRFDLSSV